MAETFGGLSLLVSERGELGPGGSNKRKDVRPGQGAWALVLCVFQGRSKDPFGVFLKESAGVEDDDSRAMAECEVSVKPAPPKSCLHGPPLFNHQKTSRFCCFGVSKTI